MHMKADCAHIAGQSLGNASVGRDCVHGEDASTGKTMHVSAETLQEILSRWGQENVRNLCTSWPGTRISKLQREMQAAQGRAIKHS